MRQYFLAAAALGAPLLIVLVLIGCGRPEDEEDAGAGDGGGAAAAGPATAAELKPLPAKHGAVLRGKVTFKGAPDIAAVNAELADEISKKPDQKPTCFDMAPDAEKTQQKWVLDGKDGVGNVVVWIQPPANTYFQVDPNDKTWPDKVELRQPHCAFIPHVTWVVPTLVDPNDPTKTIPSGQEFFVSNTAAVSHNTKWSSENSSNSSQLRTLPSGTAPKKVVLKGNNALVHFSCNIHPWMDAYVWVFNHPYADVTEPDGTYEIKNVPAGSKVRITAWHEMGPKAFSHYLTANKSKGDEITLNEGETVHDFTLDVDAK